MTSANAQNLKNSVGKNQELYDQLAWKDSVLFDAFFKTCDPKKIETILTKDFVFYHDAGYKSETTAQNYADFMKNIKASCEKKLNGTGPSMRREIVKGTLQVFSVHNAEAIQTGVQRFYASHKGQKEIAVEESKFSRTWQKVNGSWKLVRELDFMVNNRPAQAHSEERYQPKKYVPESPDLYRIIAGLDSTFFNTYNTCDMEKMGSLFADELEFYHDRGGLSTSKKETIERTKENICGKVNRILTPGSIEVYPIQGFGAVEMGYHSFRNIAEKSESEPSKFIIIWRLKDGNWQITRVISLH